MMHTPRRNKLFMITGLIAAGIVAVAGCSSSKASTSANSKPGPVTLVVYSAQGYDHAMTAAFTKATGIPVKLDDNSTGPLLTQIEASRNNPNWGLLWVDGATAFAGLDQQGLLQKGFELSVSWNTLGQQSLPADKSYTPTGVTLMVAFRGRGYEHAIDIPGHGRLTSVFSDTRAERGEHVRLRLDPRGCHLFSAGPGEAAQPVSAGLDPVTAGP